MATSQGVSDALLHSLRALLRKDGVQLWLEPYTNPDGTKGQDGKLDDLIRKYAQHLVASDEHVADGIENLRLHSLQKLNAQKQLNESNMVTLTVKLLGTNNDGELTIMISICSTGSDLRGLISRTSSLAADRLKLISVGRILRDDKTLQEQGVKLNSQILVIYLRGADDQTTGQTTLRQRESDLHELEKIREAAEVLADKKDDHGGTEAEYYLQVADQSGKTLELPAEERRALTLAMTLHEKGRAFMKRRSYNMAVLLLLEADDKFGQCRSSILTAVDNYALLCLDVVWCYLGLRNLNNLPDAEQRLNTCQKGLDRSYGANLQRVASIKGTSGSEVALYVRLHLLQAIVAYHQNRVDQAHHLLTTTQREIQALTIDQSQITQVMSMGFSEHEARIGLRACQGQMEAAVNHIMKRREEKKCLRDKEKADRKKKKLSKTLGRTSHGQWVNVDYYESLVQMGFTPGAAAEALRQTNNDVTNAIQLIEDHPELLVLPEPDSRPFSSDGRMLAQIMSMGFDEAVARENLQRYHGNVQEAIDHLLSSLGTTDNLPSTSSAALSSAISSAMSSTVEKSSEQKEKERVAMEMIVDDIPDEEEEYLDLSLEEERTYFEEYSRLLSLSEN